MVLIEYFNPIYIDGKETKYTISTLGRVYNTKTRKFIKWHYDGKYFSARLCINGKVKPFKVHRLVALAFINKPNSCNEVNHIDGDKSHNSVDNLEWVTSSDNCIHAVLNGLKPKTVKLTIEQVEAICEMLASKQYKNRKIAEEVGCSIYDVKNIKSGIAWRYISKNYF